MKPILNLPMSPNSFSKGCRIRRQGTDIEHRLLIRFVGTGSLAFHLNDLSDTDPISSNAQGRFQHGDDALRLAVTSLFHLRIDTQGCRCGGMGL